MKLYYTPRSHFARKVRILLDAWTINAELVDVGNVADNASHAFGPNPLMKVPTLVDGETWLIESDHIAAYLARQYYPSDSFDVLTQDSQALNARALLNGIMAAEVEIILASRAGIDTDTARFNKMRDSMRASLAWLNERATTLFSRHTYLGFHLVCAWDHLQLYNVIELEHARLQSVSKEMSQLEYVRTSAPI